MQFPFYKVVQLYKPWALSHFAKFQSNIYFLIFTVTVDFTILALRSGIQQPRHPPPLSPSNNNYSNSYLSFFLCHILFFIFLSLLPLFDFPSFWTFNIKFNYYLTCKTNRTFFYVITLSTGIFSQRVAKLRMGKRSWFKKIIEYFGVLKLGMLIKFGVYIPRS